MIRKNERYKCLRDVIMDDGEIAYFAHKVYKSEVDGCLTDEGGDKKHFWSDDVELAQCFEEVGNPDRTRNVFVYMRGDERRYKEVLQTLQDLGGVKEASFFGTDKDRLYYINSFGKIDCISEHDKDADWIKKNYTELHLESKREISLIVDGSIYDVVASDGDCNSCDLKGICNKHPQRPCWRFAYLLDYNSMNVVLKRRNND